jgi:hypothetical protein
MRAVHTARDGWYDLAAMWLVPGPCEILVAPDGYATTKVEILVAAGIGQRVDLRVVPATAAASA